MSLNKYYSYVHVNGSVITKRLLHEDELLEVQESSFVVKIIGPFLSRSINNAEKKAMSILFSDNSEKIKNIIKKF